jgi:hypothetical protein
MSLMHFFPPLQPNLTKRLCAVLVLIALTACESDQSRHPHRDSEAAAAPDSAIPEMAAKGTFFSGQIEVETLLNRAGFPAGGSGGGDNSANESTPVASDSSGGGGGGGRRHGGGGGSSMGGSGSDSDAPPRIRASNQPAVRLHLRLTNRGTAPVEVEVTDFDSDLGNFVVEPEKILLPPNKPVEADPMTSRLGSSSDSIPLTVSLQINGQTENRVLMLQMVKPVPLPSPAPGPTQ